MDENNAPNTGAKRPRALTHSTPSPSRRKRRLRTGSSPGCVPRIGSLTPSLALRTPPTRRLLPPSSASRTTNHRRARPAPVLRLDDEDTATAEEDGASPGDDAFSIISGEGSPERDRHMLEFLSLNTADGATSFSLFTPSPALSKSSTAARTIKLELIEGAFTPQSSPQRSSATSSPSQFFRSPYATKRGRDNAVHRGQHDGDDEEKEHEPEPRRNTPLSPRTPQRGVDVTIKSERGLPDMILCKVEGLGSSASTPSAASTPSIPWRKNSLSLMRTPSPAASARVRALKAKARAAQLLRSTGRESFGSSDDEELSAAPSALTRGQDQDWLFSFANTLSPLAPEVTCEEDLETSFLSLKFSPAVSSGSIDLQRLLPPFPSPGLGQLGIRGENTPTLKTPTVNTEGVTTPMALSEGTPSKPLNSSSSSAPSRELSESFPNIRASTSATPGRDERLKVSSSNVMKMKLHVTFDQFPPSHTKREIEAINNSIKRRKQSRKRKLEECKPRHTKASVQRKLLQTPVKDDKPSVVEAETTNTDGDEEKPRKKSRARLTQRQLLASPDDLCADSDSTTSSKSSSASVSGATSINTPKKISTTSAIAELNIEASSWRRKLSPSFASVSTPTLPPSLAASSSTPKMHALKLRKTSSLSVNSVESTATASSKTPTAVVEPKLSTSSVTSSSNLAIEQPRPTAQRDVPATTLATIPAKTPAVLRTFSTGFTPVSTMKSAILATPQVMTPAQASTTPATQIPPTTAPAAPKKKSPCNCKKSKCLKLYCECFASGGYCDESCNCVGCANTPANEEVRQQAIAARLEKNPNAFKPKIETTSSVVSVGVMTPGSGVLPGNGQGFLTPHSHSHHHLTGQVSGDVKKMHKHGCHCKKSACQKRYCECFQAGVPCGDNCRCIDCKNQSPYVTRKLGLSTPSSVGMLRGPGTTTLAPAVGRGTDSSEEQFVSPPVPSIRQRLRIDRETWAKNFSSPFEVSPRRERERTERLHSQLKNSRASALLRTFNAATAAPAGSEVIIKSEPGVSAPTQSSLSVRMSTAVSFTSPPARSVSLAGMAGRAPRSLSPLQDSSCPPPAPTPHGKNTSLPGKRMSTIPRNRHAMEALSIGYKSTGRVYVLPLFGSDLPPVKSEVSAKIFHFLSNADIYNASLVNRLWSRVTMGDTVWDHSNFRKAPLSLTNAEDQGDQDIVMEA